MALWNQIGPFEFLELRGGIEKYKEQVELLYRPGVSGVGLKQLGLQGRPFKCVSRVDATNIGAAQDGFKEYESVVGDGQAYGVAQYGKDFGIYNLQFLVLDVQLVRARAMLLFKGGLNPPSLAFVEAEWTLLPIST